MATRTPTVSVVDQSGSYVTGDAANLSLNVITDGVSAAYTGTITEVVGSAGRYRVTITESGVLQSVSGTSTTSGAIVVQAAWSNRVAGDVIDPPAAPSGVDSYLIYGYEYSLDGNTLVGANDVTVKIVSVDHAALATADDGSLRSMVGTSYATDGNGTWSFYISQGAVAAGVTITIERSWTDAGNNTRTQRMWAKMDDSVADVNDRIAWAAWNPVVIGG